MAASLELDGIFQTTRLTKKEKTALKDFLGAQHVFTLLPTGFGLKS